MPSDTGTYVHCLLCGERVDDGCRSSHLGTAPPFGGVTCRVPNCSCKKVKEVRRG